jgi:hypothetical protein
MLIKLQINLTFNLHNILIFKGIPWITELHIIKSYTMSDYRAVFNNAFLTDACFSHVIRLEFELK